MTAPADRYAGVPSIMEQVRELYPDETGPISLHIIGYWLLAWRVATHRLEGTLGSGS